MQAFSSVRPSIKPRVSTIRNNRGTFSSGVKNEVTFLGTGGARIVVAKQIRATGGMLFRLAGVSILVHRVHVRWFRLLTYLPKFSPLKIDYLILSHKHLDHADSVNIMIEAMTEGGTKPRGVLLAPHDALEEEPVVLYYLRKYLNKIKILEEGAVFDLGPVQLSTPLRHRHGVETYGLVFKTERYSIAYVTDSKFFPALAKKYRCDLMIVNLLRDEPSEYDHLALPDVEQILLAAKPRVAIITHFGMTIIRQGPWKIARRLEAKTGVKVLAAEDGKTIDIDRVLHG